MLSISSDFLRGKIYRVFFLILYTISTLYADLYSKGNEQKLHNKLEISNNYINWEKIKNNAKSDKFNIIWEKYDESELNKNINDIYTEKRIIDNESKQVEFGYSQNLIISSLNRSIVFDDKKIGPDITFLVPIGFKSFNENFLDISIRGWNRRSENSNLFQWNGGDAVGQIFYQFLHKDKSSFGLSLGIRSLYQGDLAGGGTDFGEGISSGFRWDYKLGNLIGLAIGAEQFFQFDDKTDTGRDIYLSISKAFLLSKNKDYLPAFVLTGGVGTGYFALWEKTKFACTDAFDGAAVDIDKYHKLCWGPFGAISWVFNERVATFFEYNNYSFITGVSFNPGKKLRFTLGTIIAESFDDYKFKNLDEMRLFGRFSIGF